MATLNLDADKLQKVFQTNETARTVLEHLVSRQRDRNFVDVVRLRAKLLHEGKVINDQDYEKIWLDLKELGIGTLVVGRRGGANRYNLGYSLKKFAEAAKTGRAEEIKRIKARPKQNKEADMKKKETVKKAAPAPKVVAKPIKASDANNAQSMVLQIPFGTRTASIKLPSEATREEIRAFASTLARMFA